MLDNASQAFEGSQVHATITGHVESVKNPLSGQIVADSIGQVILEGETDCAISIRE